MRRAKNIYKKMREVKQSDRDFLFSLSLSLRSQITDWRVEEESAIFVADRI
jgi:hypothetical protein